MPVDNRDVVADGAPRPQGPVQTFACDGTGTGASGATPDCAFLVREVGLGYRRSKQLGYVDT